MLIGGSSDLAPLKTVELMDLSGHQSSLPLEIQDLPTPLYGFVSALVNGQVMACGGFAVKACWSFDLELGSWSQSLDLDRPRYGAVSLVVNETTWLILGGYDPTSRGSFLSTSLAYKDGAFTKGGELPYAAEFPCVATVNNTHFFFAGGGAFGEYKKEAYLVETETWTWTRLPDMTFSHYQHSCGRVGRREIVVTGGRFNSNVTEIFSLDELAWRRGSAVPTRYGGFYDSPQVYQKVDTFLVFGGHDKYDYLDAVFEFDPVSGEWLEREERMASEKGLVGVVPFPNRYFKPDSK